ncbi:MFS transporter [Amycolatopsis acidiphila]|uniref:MFS transporter n=1 Tax=Amycolatopsis acidiphila TaxID=715473 RepID=A0A558A061_9PSEU|nr:MFS transporter [Amycolatopsis acidiphila]TVT17637.1 MFS transporter [Amycolatopsis acidiphila]UIJ60968.1 MFS transporter [Amycolatopsis acidiphila]GHG88543.1 MFS transporter [Amycolatopsis acidiphila]
MPDSSTAVVEPGTGSAAAEDPHHARRWLILVVIALAQLMVVLDATIVNIALPTAQHDLGFSSDARQWVVTAYALAFGSLLLLGGRVADLFGRKYALLIGLGGFAVASAVGGAANGFEMLVIARAAQGVFGALLAPAALSLLTTTFTDVRERGRAFGIFGAIAGGGAAVGLLLGGVLTEYLDWRWCMFVNIIIAVVALAGGLSLLRHRPSEHRPRLDLPGTVAASAGLFAVVYGFSNAETHDWSSALVWGFLAAGVVLLGVFAVLQSRVEHPLLPLRVVLDRNRGGANLSVFLLGIGMFGIFLFLTYYLQQNLGFSPVTSGLAFLPMVGALMLTATTATAVLLPRFGPRWLVALGMLIAAVGMFWLSALDVSSTYAGGVLFPLIVAGLGIGLSMAPAMNVATAGVGAHDAGVASATVNTAQQIGGSIGTALLSSIAANAVSSFTAGRAMTPQVVAEAAVHSYTTAFTWAAWIFVLGAVACGLLLKPGAPVQSETPAVHM